MKDERAWYHLMRLRRGIVGFPRSALRLNSMHEAPNRDNNMEDEEETGNDEDD